VLARGYIIGQLGHQVSALPVPAAPTSWSAPQSKMELSSH